MLTNLRLRAVKDSKQRAHSTIYGGRAGGQGQVSDAAKHVQEENTRAGLLLEQSALCLLYSTPPSRRKFAFQMVLAGLRYHAAGHKRLAVHSYRSVDLLATMPPSTCHCCVKCTTEYEIYMDATVKGCATVLP
jgi:hypothetical protein